jgi:hypothetical protein
MLRPMSASAPPSPARRRLGLGAVVALTVGWALLMQSLGWAQTSYYALVKALSDGTPQIDRYHWETRDKSYTGGHFYSVKAPGLSVLTVPLYEGLSAVGGKTLARDAADTARRHGGRQWTYRGLNVHSYGGDPRRAAQIKRRLEIQAPMVWALGLLGTVLPAALLLLLVRRRAERVEPGLGVAAAITLGIGTLVMPFATQFFGHIVAALLAFGAFVLLWREREGAPRLALLAAAGAAAGLAVFTEYPLALAGALIGVYGVLRGDAIAAGARSLARRAGAFAGGVAVGVTPLIAYNLWAFGSATHFSYADAVDEQGTTGHATLGLNAGGFFGINLPDLRALLELLFAPRGLLVVTPVVAMGVVGTVLLHRRGHRAEARLIGAIAAAFLIYDSGYWLPFGGGSPGPRFLIPMLPFLAVGLACAWRRFPATTLALAVPSAVVMVAATISYPLISTGQENEWTKRIDAANFQHTIVSVLGGDNGWWAIAPVLFAIGLAVVLAARATGALPVRRDLPIAVVALGAWALLAAVLAGDLGENWIGGIGVVPGTINHHGMPGALVWIGAGAAALALAVAAAAEWLASARQPVGDEARGHRPGEPQAAHGT